MKYIFLDIDGVLNDHDSFCDYDENRHQDIIIWHGYGVPEFVSRTMLNRLKEIVLATGAEVIGISSWFSSDMQNNDVQSISDALDLRIIDKIDCTCGGFGRSESISRFLNKNKCEKFVIIDDDKIHQMNYKEFHVMPIGYGLTDQLKRDAIDILGVE